MHLFSSLVLFLEHFRFFGYGLLFLVAFIESLAFIGLFVPGTVFVVFMGFLSAQGNFNFIDVVAFAAIGAVFGDVVSFFIGSKGKNFFKKDFFIFRVSYIEKGERFFSRHGNKSVFLGRFLGPIRPIIPFIAGLVKMDFRRFLFWNILSAIGWAALYVSLGYFFGAAWGIVQLWTTRLGVFVAIIIAGIILMYLCKIFVMKQGKQLLTFTIYLLKEFGKNIFQTKYVQRLHNKFPMALPWVKEWFWFVFLGGIAFLFLLKLTLAIVVSHGFITADLRLHNLLVVFGNPILFKIFFWVTLIGSPPVMFLSCLSVCLWFWYLDKKKYVVPFIATMVGSSLSSFVLKLVIQRARPFGSIIFEPTFSFPSSHATAAMALYGFLAVVAIRELSSWRAKINILFANIFIIWSIGFSRLYLGVHFLSDVFAGFALGLLWVVIGFAINYSEERRASHYKLSRFFFSFFSRFARAKHSKYIGISFILLNVFLVTYLGLNYQSKLQIPDKPIDKTSLVSRGAIINDPSILIARSTETLTGRAWAPINVIFVAKDISHVSDVIAAAGWSRADSNGLPSLIHLFF
ncbi:MAG: bifunctional DedA family/phosphatase PAP2 family protein, partial [Candidatus Magasanikbacteria bacterium]|nr:bifunctional DedA family/phosphatase PAP2 family protein [Candidatus Magasanikbacteria bacterium]